MNSTLKPKQTDDPHDVVAVAPDVARVVPAFEELSNLLRHAARHQSGPQANTGPGVAAASGVAATPPAPSIPTVDTTFRPAAVNDVQNNVHAAGSRRSIGRRAVRAFAALLVATCIGVAGIVLNAHGDVAKQIAKSVPKLLTSLLLQKPGLPAQPTAPTVEADAANTAPPQPASPAQAAPEAAAPAAATSPEQAQLLQSMAHDLATVGQQVEQLKASIEELKAGQQQMSREIAKASEQNLRPKISAASAPPPRPAAARPRKPMPSYPPPQAAAAPPLPQSPAPYVPPPSAAPYMPRQAEPPPQAAAQPQDEELSSVPRPPMPVR
ncbi:MAG TPA: hypothetical protein VF957_19180 [Bradyrhizobium sp.]